MMKKNQYKTIVISDIHLGSNRTKIKELLCFMKFISCDLLILNGDIIDSWQLQRGEKWKKKYTRLVRFILKMMEKNHTEVIYIKGNHDSFLSDFVPFILGDLWIVKEYIHYSCGKRYLVLHGDAFDPVLHGFKWFFRNGIKDYPLVMRLHKVYNFFKGKEFPNYTLADVIRNKQNKTEEYNSNFERQLITRARKKGCQGIICAHIHQPSIINYNEISYMNSGDWVESMTALTENHKGEWTILRYSNDLTSL